MLVVVPMHSMVALLRMEDSENELYSVTTQSLNAIIKCDILQNNPKLREEKHNKIEQTQNNSDLFNEIK